MDNLKLNAGQQNDPLDEGFFKSLFNPVRNEPARDVNLMDFANAMSEQRANDIFKFAIDIYNSEDRFYNDIFGQIIDGMVSDFESKIKKREFMIPPEYEMEKEDYPDKSDEEIYEDHLDYKVQYDSEALFKMQMGYGTARKGIFKKYNIPGVSDLLKDKRNLYYNNAYDGSPMLATASINADIKVLNSQLASLCSAANDYNHTIAKRYLPQFKALESKFSNWQKHSAEIYKKIDMQLAKVSNKNDLVSRYIKKYITQSKSNIALALTDLQHNTPGEESEWFSGPANIVAIIEGATMRESTDRLIESVYRADYVMQPDYVEEALEEANSIMIKPDDSIENKSLLTEASKPTDNHKIPSKTEHAIRIVPIIFDYFAAMWALEEKHLTKITDMMDTASDKIAKDISSGRNAGRAIKALNFDKSVDNLTEASHEVIKKYRIKCFGERHMDDSAFHKYAVDIINDKKFVKIIIESRPKIVAKYHNEFKAILFSYNKIATKYKEIDKKITFAIKNAKDDDAKSSIKYARKMWKGQFTGLKRQYKYIKHIYAYTAAGEKTQSKLEEAVTRAFGRPMLTLAPGQIIPDFESTINEVAGSDEGKLVPVYVVLMFINKKADNLVKYATNSTYSHAAISFDPSMKHMYSFAMVDEKGLVHGNSHAFHADDFTKNVYTRMDVPYAIYMVPVTQKQLALMKARIKYFSENETKFDYDLAGCVRLFFNINKEPADKWFCSRFVADILNAGRPDDPYVPKPALTKPQDFASNPYTIPVVKGRSFQEYDESRTVEATKMLLKREKERREKYGKPAEITKAPPKKRLSDLWKKHTIKESSDRLILQSEYKPTGIPSTKMLMLRNQLQSLTESFDEANFNPNVADAPYYFKYLCGDCGAALAFCYKMHDKYFKDLNGYLNSDGVDHNEAIINDYENSLTDINDRISSKISTEYLNPSAKAALADMVYMRDAAKDTNCQNMIKSDVDLLGTFNDKFADLDTKLNDAKSALAKIDRTDAKLKANCDKVSQDLKTIIDVYKTAHENYDKCINFAKICNSVNPDPEQEITNESVADRKVFYRLSESDTYKIGRNTETVHGATLESNITRMVRNGQGFVYVGVGDLDRSVIYEIFDSPQYFNVGVSGCKRVVRNLLETGKVQMVYSDVIQMPVNVPYIIAAGGTDSRIFVNVSHALKTNEYGKYIFSNARNKNMFMAQVFSACVAYAISKNYYQLPANVGDPLVLMYGYMFTNVIDRAYRMDLIMKDKVRYLATKFSLIQLYGTETGSKIFLRLRQKYFPKLSPMIMDSIDSQFTTDSFDTLSLFINEISRVYPTLAKLDIQQAWLGWIKAYDSASMFSIDYMPYMIYTIVSLLYESPLVNRLILDPMIKSARGEHMLKDLQAMVASVG